MGNALSASIVYRCAGVFGESLTREMLLTSRLTTADRAYAVGAVMSVDVGEGLVQAIRGITNPDKLAHLGPVFNARDVLRRNRRSL